MKAVVLRDSSIVTSILTSPSVSWNQALWNQDKYEYTLRNMSLKTGGCRRLMLSLVSCKENEPMYLRLCIENASNPFLWDFLLNDSTPSNMELFKARFSLIEARGETSMWREFNYPPVEEKEAAMDYLSDNLK